MQVNLIFLIGEYYSSLESLSYSSLKIERKNLHLKFLKHVKPVFLFSKCTLQHLLFLLSRFGHSLTSSLIGFKENSRSHIGPYRKSHSVLFSHLTSSVKNIFSPKNCYKIMGIEIKNVLICDAVDSSCVDLLKFNGIEVDYKLKLPKEQLIKEAKVNFSFWGYINLQLKYFFLEI